MKKLAIGCGIVVLILFVSAVAVFYVAARKARSYLQDTGAIAALQTLGKGVVNTSPFTPPANGELTPEMLKRFAAVEDGIVEGLGPRFREIAAMQDAMMAREQAEHRKATPAEDFKNVTAMMGFILEAQGTWVDALNRQRFSMDEYEWVRGRVWSASGLNVLELSTRDISTLASGRKVTHSIGSSADGMPARNRDLVAPYLPRMKNWIPIAFFGL
jgi:hypothetical protein